MRDSTAIYFLALLFHVTVTLSSAAVLPRASTTFSIATSGTKKCLDVVNGNLTNGVAEQIKTCSSPLSPSQKWSFTTASVSGKTLLQTSSNLCLDVPNGKASNGTALQIWSCNSSNSNQFFARDGNAIRWNGSKYCLDVYHGTSKSFADGLSVVLWECSVKSANQYFVPVPTTTATATSTSTSTVKTTVSVAASTTPIVSTTKTTSSSSISSSSSSSSSIAAPLATKPALTSIFKPKAKRMLAYGYDNRVAGGIGSGPMISSYHHWQDDVIPQMPAKDTFIPTYWGVTKNASWAQVKTTLGSTIPPVVMSFNEPDVSSQANMDPIVAAQTLYNEITIPFGNRGSNVVSPAIAWNVDGWLTPFMNKCTQLGCNIDAIGQHIYVGINGNVSHAVSSVKSQINNVYNKFGKPIVLSEIGLTNAGGGSDEDISSFVQQVGNFLDNSDHVLAWALSAVFKRGDGWDGYLNSNMSFFTVNGTISDLGNQYMYNLY